MSKEFDDRLLACERSNRRLKALVYLQSSFLGLLLTGLFISYASANRQDDIAAATLKVKELVVVDAQGLPRVRIGSDLPDAVMNGKTTPRRAKAAGVILYDTTGQERGGYLTFDNGNVALTLDSRQQQTALFVAGPDGGTALRLWDTNGSVELRSDDDGSRVTTAKAGHVVYQRPEIPTLGQESCTAYKEVTTRLPHNEVLASCQSRFTDVACQACVAEPAE